MTRTTDHDRPRPNTTNQPTTTDHPTEADQPTKGAQAPLADSAADESGRTDAGFPQQSTPATMREISHRNPFTGETAGHFLVRGPIVRTDGGEETRPTDESAADSREEHDGDDESDEHARKMKNVDHTPPKDAADANRVFERGGRESIVESEE